MHTPNDEIKTNIFLPVSDVGGEETCFFNVFFFKCRVKNTLSTIFNFSYLHHGIITHFILYYNSMVS